MGALTLSLIAYLLATGEAENLGYECRADSKGLIHMAGEPGLFSRVALPEEIYNRTISSRLRGGTRTIEITFPDDVPLDGQAILEVYYDTEPGGTHYDEAVIAPISLYTYEGVNGKITPLTAKYVRCRDREILRDATLSISSRRITIEHEVHGEKRTPHMVLLRYLPESTSPDSVGGGINSIPRFSSYFLPDKPVGSLFLTLPVLPENPITPSLGLP